MRNQWKRSATSTAIVAALVLGSIAIIPTAVANPSVPFCGGASGAGGTSQTSESYDPATCEQTTGRVFPEAIARDEYTQPDASGHSNTGYATDYLGFFEWQRGLAYLEENYPDFIEVHIVADSYGLCPAGSQNSVEQIGTGERADCPVERDRFPIYMVEVTNEKSPMPLEERQSLLFMLSIHGVEKGGREGGARVLEDLVKGISFASETVQHGAGMPSQLDTPTGGIVETYQDMLDFTRVFLLFPNSDGWAHDEVPYTTSDTSCGAPPNGASFCRTNGNGVDLNRQSPTLGWHNPNRNPVGEPESIGYYNWMLQNNIKWTYAIDIHGMINHPNFVAIMLPAASMTPQEMERSLGLAETLKQRLNNEAHFAEWKQAAEGGEGAGGVTGGGSPSQGFATSQFAEYFTVIDAIGYTDSGFNGDYFAQDTGLNAPGYDIELAYNHVNSDSQYEGQGQFFNDYHIKVVREIMKTYMDAASLDVTISLESNGKSTLVLENPTVMTNLDDTDADGNPAPNLPESSWAAQNPGDDLWDYSEETPFTARPHEYWEDMKPFVVDGDAPGILNFQSGSGFTRATLDQYQNFVIPGGAIDVIKDDSEKIQAIMDWVEAGGTLVLTDSALKFLSLAGVLEESDIYVEPRYMGGIKVEPYAGHELLEGVRGGVMQMYEPTPLGYGTSSTAPNWAIDANNWTSAGGEIAGRECGLTQLNTPACDDNGIGLGQVKHGNGMIRVMGSLLPDPTEEFYHPYGLDPYATTYSGNAIMLNLLGWGKVYAAPAVQITEDGRIIQSANEIESAAPDAEEVDEQDTPTVGPMVLLLALAALAIVRRRE